jgi:prepilin-type N-terminal cleavage/methylation domain-containing protein
MTMTRWRHRLSGDGGFSLVEMIVALTVAAMLLTGGAYVLGSSMKTVVAVRANSQAAELISESIEQLRSSAYAAVAMDPADLSGDSRISGSPGAQTFDPDAGGSKFGEETVLAVTGGVVKPHLSSVTRNDQVYSLARYVTVPPTDSSVSTASYKRVTVIVTWTSGGLTHTRQSSSFITLTRRGLPLPSYQMIAERGSRSTDPIVVNAGAPLTLPYSVVNRGAQDGFNLSMASTPTLSVSYTQYHDADSSTTKTSADVAASDVDGNGVPDTGTLAPDATARMLAYGTVPSSAAAGTFVVTVTATSVGQPTVVGASRTTSFYVRVLNQSTCTGCTYSAFYLRNQYPACVTAPCATTQKVDMPLRSDAGTATSLPNYDTDVDGAGGRNVARNTSTPTWTSSTSSTMANWRYTVPYRHDIKGNVLLDVYVAPSGSGSVPSTLVPLNLTAYLTKSTTGSGTAELVATATATLAASSSTDYRFLRFTFSGVDTSVNNNRYFEVKIVVDSTSTTGAWLAYDTTTYPSVLWVPVT